MEGKFITKKLIHFIWRIFWFGRFLNILIKLSSFSNYSHPWADISPHIRLNEIFEGVEGLVKESPSTNHRLQEYLDQYIKVLEEDRTRFIDKVGDAGGGQYVVHFHGIEVLKNRFHEKIFQFRKSINIKIKFTIFFFNSWCRSVCSQCQTHFHWIGCCHSWKYCARTIWVQSIANFSSR